MTEDVCGAECADGSECQHAAGSCPVPSHTDDSVDKNPQGRPSKLKDRKADVFEAAKKGATLKGCARAAGIDESTLHRWIDKYDEFVEELYQARWKGEQRHLDNVDNRGSQFILERSFGYVKTEKRDVDLSGELSFSSKFTETDE